jgi:TonB family protein
MKFTIRRDGVLEGIQIEKPSGFYVLDMTAQRAVVLTARLPPLPKQFPNPTLMVRLRFDY